MKKLVLAMSFVCMATFCFAQDFSVRGGLNVSNLNASEGDGMDSRMGYQVGVMFDSPLSSANCGYQVGLLLSSKGAKYSEGDYEEKENLSYLQLQACFNYAPIEKLKFNVGPFLAYGMGGKTKIEDEEGSYDFDSFDDGMYKKLDYGLTIGASYDISKLYVYAGYDFGLANIADEDDEYEGGSDIKVKTRNFSVGVGFRF